MSYDRATLQQIAELRLAEARVLLDHNMPSGAYYLAGYAVECALKAILAKQFRAETIPEVRVVREIYTHNLDALLQQTGTQSQIKENQALRERWQIASEWSESARYKPWTDAQASLMIDAIDGEEGLLRWLLTQ